MQSEVPPNSARLGILKIQRIRPPVPRTPVQEFLHIAVLAVIPMTATVLLGLFVRQIAPLSHPLFTPLITVACVILGAGFFILTILIDNWRNLKAYEKAVEALRAEEPHLFEMAREVAERHFPRMNTD